MSAGAAVALFCTCLDQEAVLCVALLPLTILSHRLLIIVFPWTSILGWSSSTSSSGHLVRSCSSWSSSALNDCSFLIWWTLYHQHNLRYPFTTFLLSKQPVPIIDVSQPERKTDHDGEVWQEKEANSIGLLPNFLCQEFPFWCGNGDSQTFRDFLSPAVDDTHLCST